MKSPKSIKTQTDNEKLAKLNAELKENDEKRGKIKAAAIHHERQEEQRKIEQKNNLKIQKKTEKLKEREVAKMNSLISKYRTEIFDDQIREYVTLKQSLKHERLNNPICIHCDSEYVTPHTKATKRYLCKNCGRTFYSSPLPYPNKYYEIKIIQLLLEGLSQIQISELLRVSRNTTRRVYSKHGNFLESILESQVRKKRILKELVNFNYLSSASNLKKLDDKSILVYAENPDYRTSGIVVNRHKDARFKIHTDEKLLTIIVVEPDTKKNKD